MSIMCSDIIDIEEALSKTGAELFKELYRIYPVAEPEDYFKNGAWKNEVMKTDLVLLEAHMRECGAPDPKDLDEVKPPPLPSGTFVNPGAAPGTGFGASGQLGLKPQGNLTVSASGAAAITAAQSAPVVEIRLIALFVAKWKLDPVQSKTVLAKLTPTRRRYIIQNFKPLLTGLEATKELEDYIAQCEKDGSWDNGSANGADASAAITPKSAAAITPKSVVPKPAVAAKPVGPVAAAGAKVQPKPAVAKPNAILASLKRQQEQAGIGNMGTLGNPAWGANKRPALGMGAGPMMRPAFMGVGRPPAITPRPKAW